MNVIDGVPQQIVSDNLKAGITKACVYELTVNRTYADLAAHYRTAIEYGRLAGALTGWRVAGPRRADH